MTRDELELRLQELGRLAALAQLYDIRGCQKEKEDYQKDFEKCLSSILDDVTSTSFLSQLEERRVQELIAMVHESREYYDKFVWQYAHNVKILEGEIYAIRLIACYVEECNTTLHAVLIAKKIRSGWKLLYKVGKENAPETVGITIGNVDAILSVLTKKQ